MTTQTTHDAETLPRLASNLAACVRWRRADLAELVLKQLRMLQAEDLNQPLQPRDPHPA